MITGYPIIDALASGAISAFGGMMASRLLKREKTREFYRTGGFTYDQAMQAANELGQSGGWKIAGPITRSIDVNGRKLCYECLTDFDLNSSDEDCPACGIELDVMRDEVECYSVELYRDV